MHCTLMRVVLEGKSDLIILEFWLINFIFVFSVELSYQVKLSEKLFWSIINRYCLLILKKKKVNTNYAT